MKPESEYSALRRWWRRTFPPCEVTGGRHYPIPADDNYGGSMSMFGSQVCADCGKRC